MQTRRIGEVQVSAIGYGEMQLSLEDRPEEADAVRVIHAVLDLGVTLIDTADAYCISTDEHGHGERLVATALASYGGDTDGVLVATKGGHYRPGDGSWKVDASPDYLRKACDDSLVALGVERIGLYQLHRPDARIPYADSLGALEELHEAGKIRYAGVSNANVNQIKQAQQILGDALVSVQNQYSLVFRSSEAELNYCAEQGLAFLPWGPLGGARRAPELGSELAGLVRVARAHDVSPQQVALAWMLAKAPVVIPIPGARRVESITDSVAAADLVLTADELAEVDAV